MKLSTISIKGSSLWNEDSLIVHNNLNVYGVIDGATSLVPFTGTNGETGGCIAARLIAQDVLNVSLEESREFVDLKSLLVKSNQRLRMEMQKFGIDVTNKEAVWSACAVLVSIQTKWIEYAHAGDCMLIVYYEDGTIRVVTHDQLAHVDNLTLSRWSEGVAAGLSSRDDLWEHTKPQIVLGRQLANTVSGYAVVNGDSEFDNYIEFGRISRMNVKSLLLISDGLYLPKEAKAKSPKVDGAAEVAEHVREMGLEGYVKWLIGLEESDPDCLRYPRVKKSDDKTAIYLEFETSDIVV